MQQIRLGTLVLALCMLILQAACQQATDSGTEAGKGPNVVETLHGGGASGIDGSDPWELQGFSGYRCGSQPQFQVLLPAGGGELVEESAEVISGIKAQLLWRGRKGSPVHEIRFGTDQLGTAAAARFAQYVENLRRGNRAGIGEQTEQSIMAGNRNWILLPLPDTVVAGRTLRQRFAVAQHESLALCLSLSYDPAPEFMVEEKLIAHLLEGITRTE